MTNMDCVCFGIAGFIIGFVVGGVTYKNLTKSKLIAFALKQDINEIFRFVNSFLDE